VITGVKFKDGIEVTTGNQVAAGSISKHQIWRELPSTARYRYRFTISSASLLVFMGLRAIAAMGNIPTTSMELRNI